MKISPGYPALSVKSRLVEINVTYGFQIVFNWMYVSIFTLMDVSGCRR